MNLHQFAESLAHLPLEKIREVLQGMSESDMVRMLHDWEFMARPAQLMPDHPQHRCSSCADKPASPGIGPDPDYFIALLCAGRGFGKTRTGAETVIQWMREDPRARIALLGATAGDYRDVMVEGESGLLACAPPDFQLHWEPSRRKITAPNGAVAICFSAEEPERLRGPQFTKGWADEVAAYKDRGAWDMLQFCVRLGKKPQLVVTTTPKATELIVELVTKTERVHIVRGSTFDNSANLATQYLSTVKRLYGGTRLGQQELEGALLLDNPGALFQRQWFDGTRVPLHEVPKMRKTIVAVDPAPTSNEGSDFTGIVVAGIDYNGHVYLLKDYTMRGSPDEWARVAVRAYHKHMADKLVAETNTGGDLVGSVIKTIDSSVTFREVRARKSKEKRAEPVAAMWEQGKIHLVGTEGWEEFEKQAAVFSGVNGKRDDRVDAAMWAVHDLALSGTGFIFV